MNTTTHSSTGAMTHSMDAKTGSMVSVRAMPPTSNMGARMPMVWVAVMKFCTL